jgi:cytosine/adenosine deaminase-related metal-dependent hydrolase
VSAPSRWTLSARYGFPVEEEPIAEALITIEGGQLAAVEPARGRQADLALGNVAVIPGLVNAHTHLELAPLPPPSESAEDQIAWLGRVIAQRRDTCDEGLRANIRDNLASSIAAGITLLGDITTAGRSWEALVESPVRAVVFTELIGLMRERAMDVSLRAFEWLARVRPQSGGEARTRPGLSPHAPYSTAAWVYERATHARLPLATHLAEMPEELELLAARSGRLRTFLEDLGAWSNDWRPVGERPSSYLRRGPLRQADWIVAHGTYLPPDDFWMLRRATSAAPPRVAIAYCPRTTARFGHGPHPYWAMLEAGAVVCLGTDSLASSPSLSILDEMRALARADETFPREVILTMGTLAGSWALRAETTTGSLKPGKAADLAVIALPDREDEDPHRLLFDSDLPVVATMCAGRFVHGPWRSPETRESEPSGD